ncbi:hypothetical protein BH09BAC2_BH09BAC2_12330 [soil metagenome]
MKITVILFFTFLLCTSLKAQFEPTSFKALEQATTQKRSFLNNLSLFSSSAKTSIAPAAIVPDPVTKNNLFTDRIEKASSMVLKYAMLMNVSVENLNNSSLYSFVESWYGTKYKMGGTTKKGVDCSAFSANLIQNIFSVFLPRTAREQYKYCEPVSKENLSEGDLVFFNTRGGISHVGVYLVDGNFVHASSGHGVTISNLADPYYSKRYVGAGKIK